MGEHDAAIHRQQDLYWKAMLELKTRSEYVRRYRNQLQRKVSGVAALRAIASSGAIGAWAVVQAHPLIWGGIIAAAQVADVLKDVFPLTARHRAAAELTMALDALLIDALFEWESVFGGDLTDKEIAKRRRNLMERQHQASTKYFPTGDLSDREDLLELAKGDAQSYFKTMFGDGLA